MIILTNPIRLRIEDNQVHSKTASPALANKENKDRTASELLLIRVRELAAIAAFTRDVTSKLSLTQMLAAIHRHINSVVPSDLTAIFLRSADRMIMEKEENKAINLARNGPIFGELSDFLSGTLTNTGIPVYAADLQSDPCFPLDQCSRSGLRSLAVLPMVYGNKIIGALALASLTIRKFSDQAHFLETIASQTAICLHNTMLYEQLQSQVQELEKLQGERKQANLALKKRETELEINTKKLDEVNTALKVLLKQREQDKTDLEEKVVIHMKALVLPYLEKLKTGKLSARQKSYIDDLESNLNEIISPFVRRLSSSYWNLTPKEIQIADLVKKGKTSKEIAAFFNSSVRVVDFHRHNIRKKFGLINKRSNLKTHLLSLS